MAGEASIDPPSQYNDKSPSGDLVQRPNSPLSPRGPQRQSYQAFHRPGPYESDSRDHHYASESEAPRTGPRRRPSSAARPPRRHSHSEYDVERPSFNSKESQQRLRDRERERDRDDYWRDEERDYYYRRDRDDGRHPDHHEWSRSRPPRAYRNYERGMSSSKNEIEESRSDWRDLEKGNMSGSPERFGNGRAWRNDDEQSLDGYNYEGTQHGSGKTLDFKNLTPQERAQVLRLPWLQWMHSNIKNRESYSPFSIKVTNDYLRLCGLYR